jgi:TolB-like protein
MRLVAVLMFLALPAAAHAARVKVAVTEVKSVQGVQPGTATILSDIIVSEVSRQGYDVISQSDISAMVGFEKQKKMLGCDETSCLAEIGGALGVDYLIAGQVGQIGSRYRISLLVVDSRKARVTGRAANFCDQNEDALARAAEATVSQLITSMRAGESNQLPPPAVAPARAVAPAPAQATAPAPQPREASAGQTSTSVGGRHMTTGTWIAWGGGGALVLVGVAAVAGANKKYDELKAKQGTPGYLDAYNADAKGIRSQAVLGTVLVGAGVVAAGVGGWLYWRSDRAAVALIPTAGDGGAGLLAVGRF